MHPGRRAATNADCGARWMRWVFLCSKRLKRRLGAWRRLRKVKALISKADLKRIALQEIRAFPGSDHVISVEVECETGPLEFQI